MKVIVTYASAGTGHRRAAEALYDYFKEHCSAFDLGIIDALEKTNPLFKNIYGYGYPFLVNHAPWLWRFSFWVTSLKPLRTVNKVLVSLTNRLNTKSFADFLIKENADFIISTHFLPSEVSIYLKKNKKIDSKLVTVITDFGVHPFWVSEGTDIYIVASDSTKEELARQGIEEDIIKDIGIPIDLRFSNQYEKEPLHKKFGLKPNEFTILVSTGSFGIGQIQRIIDLLYREVQILVVCANNEKLYTRLKKRSYPQVKVFGFVNNMQELMAVSDIIITKPGGLTISESLAMDLLPIFITAIPGQETENVKFLAENSVGIVLENIALIKDIVLDFKVHPDKIKGIKEKISRLKKPYAAKELCNVICQSSGGPAY